MTSSNRLSPMILCCFAASACLFGAACGSDDGTTQPANNGSTSNNGATQGADMSTSSDSGSRDAGGVDMGSPDAGEEADQGTTEVDRTPLDVMDRPADVVVPDDYDGAQSYPLLVLLHGYSANALVQDFYFGTSERVNEREFILVTPDGTSNPEGKKFWNAYWCCDFYRQDVDDVAYISGLIDAAKARYNVDPKRVYFLGHSNGGFMSYRMACEVDGIAAIASLAGAGPLEEQDCSAGGTVSILQIHGTLDATIGYNGTPGQYPPTREMVSRWVSRNGCDAEPTEGTPMNLVAAVPGDETTPETWENCDDGTSVALWTINGGGHIPTPNDAFKDGILDFLFSQQAP